MNDNFWGTDKKDPLKIDIKETSKTILKGAIAIGIGIPLLTGLASLIGGSE